MSSIEGRFSNPMDIEVTVSHTLTIAGWIRVVEILNQLPRYAPLEEYKDAIRRIIETFRLTIIKENIKESTDA